MNRIIVTSGAGFIWSAVARHIINHTQDAVCVVDKLTYAGNQDNLTPSAKSDRFKSFLSLRIHFIKHRGKN